jgi:hypothetical protein
VLSELNNSKPYQKQYCCIYDGKNYWAPFNVSLIHHLDFDIVCCKFGTNHPRIRKMNYRIKNEPFLEEILEMTWNHRGSEDKIHDSCLKILRYWWYRNSNFKIKIILKKLNKNQTKPCKNQKILRKLWQILRKNSLKQKVRTKLLVWQ